MTGWSYIALVKDKKSKFAVFDKNGKILSEEAFDRIEKHINSLLKEIMEKSKTVDNE